MAELSVLEPKKKKEQNLLLKKVYLGEFDELFQGKYAKESFDELQQKVSKDTLLMEGLENEQDFLRPRGMGILDIQLTNCIAIIKDLTLEESSGKIYGSIQFLKVPFINELIDAGIKVKSIFAFKARRVALKNINGELQHKVITWDAYPKPAIQREI